MDSRNDDAALIAQELFEWSRQCLEPPSSDHGGLPSCPFAKQEWTNGQIVIHITEDLDSVVDLKAHYPPTDNQSHLIAWTGWDEVSVDEFNDWIDEQNASHFGVWLMGFHPDAPEDETIPDLKLPDDWPETDDYAVILMQSLSRVVAASQQLLGTRYYESYSNEDMQMIHNRKESHDAWKEKVDEVVYRQREEDEIARRSAQKDS
jgi:hypothetical protein